MKYKFFLLFLLSLKISNSNSSIQNLKLESFLKNVITTKFSECSIVFYFDLDSRFESFGNLIESTKQIYYSLQSNNEYHQFNGSIHPASNESLNSTSPVKFINPGIDGNKLKSRCKVVLIFLKNLKTKFIEEIYKTISPVFTPLVQKNIDPFIFIVKPELANTVLLSPQITLKIKFKIVVAETQESDGLLIRTVSMFCDKGNPKIMELSPTQETTFFPDFVTNLKGKLLRISIPAVTPRIQAPPPWTGVNNAKRGMWKYLFTEFLMLKFNFTYNMFLSTGKTGKIGSGSTGLRLPNGKWIGTVGDIVNGRADMCIITTRSLSRIQVVAFSNSIFDTGYLGFVTSEGKKVFSPLALLKPFDLLMWGCMLLSTIVALLVFAFLNCVLSFIGISKDESLSFTHRGVKTRKSWALKDHLYFLMTTYLDQDCVLPSFPALRCFVAFWLFFTLIVTTIYRSKLVSILAFPIIEKLPTTFDELAQSKFQVGFLKHGDAAYNVLKASTDPTYVKLVNEMEIITGAGLECLERVVAKKYACIAYELSMRYIVEKNLSDSDIRRLVVAPATTFNIWLGLVFEGGSIYKENFDNVLAWTRPFALSDYWEKWDYYYNVRKPKREWWQKTNQTEKLKKATENKAEDHTDLTLKHISGAFYGLVFGLLFCLLVFFWEILKFRKGVSPVTSIH